MALNPPIEALPTQESDRDGNLQRYLSGLPDFASWQDQEGPAQQVEKKGSDVIQDREIEAAERRNERKIRRREKAAILKPKPTAPPDELDQEWWDKYRAQKQGLLSQNRNTELEKEIERGEMIMEKKENRRLQSRIPISKGRGKGKGIPGMEIIEAYRPMTTALGPRMTMRPETKKGMFANGKSSNPGIINLLESTKATNPRASSSQSTPGRLTMESPETKGDWRDLWRRKSSQPQSHSRQVNDKLPDPGYTNSTSWPSTLPSSDGPSKASRRRTGPMEVVRRRSVDRSAGQDLARYKYRHPSIPLDPRRSPPHENPCIPDDLIYRHPNYPVSHDTTDRNTSNHLYHSQFRPDHLEESGPELNRYIYMNQSLLLQGPRSHQAHNEVYQAYNPYSQAYSSLPSHNFNSHPYNYSHSYQSRNSHPDQYTPPHDEIPQTPIFQDRRDNNTNSIMNIPPPFSTTGPSRYRHESNLPSFYPQADQWESNEHLVSGEDQQHQYPPHEDIQKEGLQGFWKGRRPVSGSRAEQDRQGMSMFMDADQAPIQNQYDYQPNHPAQPSHHEQQDHPFIPGQYPINLNSPYRHQHHQHKVHDSTTFPPQAYLTPQIHNTYHPYDGSGGRHHTPLPISIQSRDHRGPVSYYRHEESRARDLREKERVEDQEEETMEFGASTDEWKLLWSSRKA